MKILLTGGNGFLASNIERKLVENGYDITSINRKILDLTNTSDCLDFFKKKYFDFVIHCAILGGKRLIPDNANIVIDNIRMATNLLINKKSFGQLIHFGSGAELDRSFDIDAFSDYASRLPEDYYGFSKNVICRLFNKEDNFHNLRIYNVFNSNESEGRMITTNILNYLNKKPIVINQDKYMDFMFFDDFYEILLAFIKNEIHYSEIDCVYKEKLKISDIANIINNLDSYKVAINIEKDGLGKSYCGTFSYKSDNFIGLQNGIKKVYLDIKNEKLTN